MTGQASWMFIDLSGRDRMRQVTETRLLRLKVELWYRPYFRFMRRWTSR